MAAAPSPLEYAERLTGELSSVLGEELAAGYLHGSAALGGWVPERSDVDILFVLAGEPDGQAVTAAGDLLIRSWADCPGRGLECSLVTAGQAARPAPPWPYTLHAGLGPGGPRLHAGGDRGGDRDLLMHYAVCRAAGVTLAGPPPGAVIGTVARPAILTYLADEAVWGLANAPEPYPVLNACRALVYLHEDRIVSKVAGARAALRRGLGPAGLVRRALDQQQARAPERQPGPDAAGFVHEVAAALRAAAAH